jgi:hypothetical protein
MDLDGDISITNLLGTDTGSEHTSKFINLSGAYEKKLPN